MNTDQIKKELSLEIQRLQHARAVLAGIEAIIPKKRGRPAKAVLPTVPVDQSAGETSSPPKVKKSLPRQKRQAKAPSKKAASLGRPARKRAKKTASAPARVARKSLKADPAPKAALSKSASTGKRATKKSASKTVAPIKTRTKRVKTQNLPPTSALIPVPPAV